MRRSRWRRLRGNEGERKDRSSSSVMGLSRGEGEGRRKGGEVD